MIEESDVEDVEKTTLGGMEANVITLKEAAKYNKNNYIYLFQPTEGYVLLICGDSNVAVDELKKFADNLNIVRTGDGAFETAEEREARLTMEEELQALNEKEQNELKKAVKEGIPSDKIASAGTEVKRPDGEIGYTVNNFEYLNSIDGFDKKYFYDYFDVKPWLKDDGTLMPYTRQHYKITSDNSQLISEEKVEQEFLKVDVTIHCYADQKDTVALDAVLRPVEQRENGTITWNIVDTYESVSADNYNLQMDNRAIYLDEAMNLNGTERAKQFFYRNMNAGDKITYTLLFAVDKDREGTFVLEFNGLMNSPWGGSDRFSGYHALAN